MPATTSSSMREPTDQYMNLSVASSTCRGTQTGRHGSIPGGGCVARHGVKAVVRTDRRSIAAQAQLHGWQAARTSTVLCVAFGRWAAGGKSASSTHTMLHDSRAAWTSAGASRRVPGCARAVRGAHQPASPPPGPTTACASPPPPPPPKLSTRVLRQRRAEVLKEVFLRDNANRTASRMSPVEGGGLDGEEST